MKKLISLLLIGIGCAGQLWAADLPGLEELLLVAGRNNLELKRQVTAVEQAGEKLPDFWKINESRLSLDGSYNSESAPGADDRDFSGEVSITLPIIEQLSLGASLDDRGQGSLSLNLNPFTFDTSRYAAEESYTKALNRLAAQREELAASLREAVLNWNYAQQNLAYTEAALDWQRENLVVMERKYELGDIAADQLDGAEEDYLNARQSYYDGANAFLRSRQAVYLLLGPGEGEREIPEIGIKALLDLSETRTGEVEQINLETARSETLTNLELELTRLERELKATFPVQPTLSLAANLGLPEVAYGARASLSLSGTQLKFDARADLKAEIELKKADLALEEYRLSLEVQMLKQSIDIAAEMLELNRMDLETAGVEKAEAEFLYARGERTSLEVRRSELDSLAAELRLYQGAVKLFQAQVNFLALF